MGKGTETKGEKVRQREIKADKWKQSEIKGDQKKIKGDKDR